MKYTVKKQLFSKGEIERIEILFDNGDYFSIAGSEIVDYSLKFYDKLVLRDDYNYGVFCPFVHDGFIKLNLRKNVKGAYSCAKVYNVREYNKDRILYIKNRLINEGGMECVKIYNEYNGAFSYYGVMSAKLEGEDLVIYFVPKNNSEAYESDEHYINLPDFSKSNIRTFKLDLENCEGVTIYQDEIQDIKIDFDEKLTWVGWDYIRQVKGAQLTVVLDPTSNLQRQNYFFDGLKKGMQGNKQIEERLAGKKGMDLHDICHFYVDYWDGNTGASKRECILINDIRSDEELIAIEKYEQENEYGWWEPYQVGGYSEKQPDGSLLLSFGEQALNNQKCQKLLEKCSALKRKK